MKPCKSEKLAKDWFSSIVPTLKDRRISYDVVFNKNGYNHVVFINHLLVSFGVFYRGCLVSAVLMEHVNYDLASDPAMRILFLYVRKQHRRKKLGTSMVSACFSRMMQFQKPFFWASNNDGDSEHMRSLLKKFGLTESRFVDKTGMPFLRMRFGETRNTMDEIDKAIDHGFQGYMANYNNIQLIGDKIKDLGQIHL